MGKEKVFSPEAKKYLCIIGGFLIHLVIGSVYITGNISIYMASYLQHQGHSVSLEDLSIILPLQICGSTSTLIIGTYLTERFNSPWLTVSLGNSILILAVFITSYLTDFALIVIVYGYIYGAGVGLSYTTPLLISWSHFPSHKGRINGLILAAFGLSASMFNLVSTHMINPENKKPDDKYDGVKYFDSDVADRYPPTMRWLAFMYLMITLPGLALLRRVEKGKEEEQEQECPSLIVGLKSKSFWILFGIGFVSVIPGYFVVNTYKVFGKKMIDDDEYLAIVGSVSSFFNGSFRFVWGQALDKFEFKKTYLCLLSIQTCLILTLYNVATSKPLYLIWVSFILCCEGGHFAIFPATFAKLYGKKMGTKLVGVLFYGFAFGAITSYILNITVVESAGYQSLYIGLGISSILCYTGTFFLKNTNFSLKNDLLIQETLSIN